MASGLGTLGSLGDRADAILDQFSNEELLVIDKFITAIAQATREQVAEFERGR